MRARIFQRQFAAGFSLLELTVILALVGILAAVGLPAMLGVISRGQLTSSTREISALMRAARIEAVRRGAPVVVSPDAGGRTFMAFVNSERDADGLYSNLTYDNAEPVISRFELPAQLQPVGPVGDSAANTFAGTAPSPPFAADLTIDGAVFMPDGSALAEGALRIADSEGRNHLEVRLAPRFTGRVAVRKFHQNPPVADQKWYESGFVSDPATGSGPNTWEWY